MKLSEFVIPLSVAFVSFGAACATVKPGDGASSPSIERAAHEAVGLSAAVTPPSGSALLLVPMPSGSAVPSGSRTLGALLQNPPALAATPAFAAMGDSGPTSCPADMVLVEGDYCTRVEHDCKTEWFAEQNKKRVCEQFKPGARCVGSREKKRYCVDRYEWPNQKGVRPEVMNTFYQAQLKCAAAGKRMCTESEWSFACEGPEMKPFPYGYTRDPSKCNGDHEWDAPDMEKVGARDAAELARIWKGVPSGSQPECVSDFGVHDMPGNADEVCAGEARAKFAAVNTGGPWYSGVRNQCRPKVYTHSEDFYYYFLSFRCCAAPDGGPNEALTKKQVADGISVAEVERLAGFTTAQMKQVLELKQKGECQCDGNRLPGLTLKGPKYLCKTMCGTLLGPKVKDATSATRVLHKSRRKLD
ncbi:MAG: hypothetical protein EXR75_03405 [Myxococcales bacterium]|nr:hypothetical protein [Myxococcales bacterium]